MKNNSIYSNLRAFIGITLLSFGFLNAEENLDIQLEELREFDFHHNASIVVDQSSEGWWHYSSITSGHCTVLWVLRGSRAVDPKIRHHPQYWELAIALPDALDVGEKTLVQPYRSVRDIEVRSKGGVTWKRGMLKPGEFVGGGTRGYASAFLCSDDNLELWITLVELREERMKVKIEGGFRLTRDSDPNTHSAPDSWVINLDKTVDFTPGTIYQPESVDKP